MRLELDSLGLTAFLTVCQTKNFTRAAERLHITQSALSQRITRFEEHLGMPLIVRDAPNFSLTQAGCEVLKYGQKKQSLMDELSLTLRPHHSSPFDGFRIGGFSSILRSIVIPALSSVVKDQKNISIHFFSKELDELPSMLFNGDIDIAFLNYEILDQDIIKMHLFDEEYLLIESIHHTAPDIYIDHDEKDQTTFNFLAQHRLPYHTIKRSFFDDIYGVLDAVRLGFGRAVVPLHLLETFPDVRPAQNFHLMKSPVFLHAKVNFNATERGKYIIQNIKNECLKYVK